MNNSASGAMTDRIWLSFHSNAAGPGSGSRGDYGLINSVPTPNQSALALTIGQTISQDMTAQNSRWQYPWGIQPYTYSGGYSEISNNIINGEFDATILEVAYHDNTEDADALLEDPKVRDAVAKASVHGIITFLHSMGGQTNTTYLPDPPTDVRATTDSSGNVTLNWSPGPTGSPYGDAPTSYRVYTSTNGYGFGNGYSAQRHDAFPFRIAEQFGDVLRSHGGQCRRGIMGIAGRRSQAAGFPPRADSYRQQLQPPGQHQRLPPDQREFPGEQRRADVRPRARAI